MGTGFSQGGMARTLAWDGPPPRRLEWQVISSILAVAAKRRQWPRIIRRALVRHHCGGHRTGVMFGSGGDARNGALSLARVLELFRVRAGGAADRRRDTCPADGGCRGSCVRSRQRIRIDDWHTWSRACTPARSRASDLMSGFDVTQPRAPIRAVRRWYISGQVRERRSRQGGGT